MRNFARYAIKGSPNQKLLLEDIYYAIESRVRKPTQRVLFVLMDSTFSSLTSVRHRLDGR